MGSIRKVLATAALALVSMFLFVPAAFAAEGGVEASVQVAAALAAGLGIGIAAFGGSLGQGRAAAAALEGIARNPSASDKLFVPMILGLALIESLVIYALLISFQLVGKIG